MGQKNFFDESQGKKNGKTKFMNIRVSEEEKVMIDQLAEKCHIPVSKLIIDTVVNQKSIHNENSVEIAKALCELAYEIEYVVISHPSLKDDFNNLREEVVSLWHTLSK